MSGLRMIEGSSAALTAALLADTERCAVGYAQYDPAHGRWLLLKAEPVAEAAYESRDAMSATLTPAALVDIANRARREALSPVFIHTHPFAKGQPVFSAIDDAGEAELAAYLAHRVPAARPLAMVIGPDGLRARMLAMGKDIPVWEVGSRLRRLDDAARGTLAEERFDRQVRAFGAAGQRAISALKILVVGSGGTGLATILQLAYLGATDLTVIDPDRVEVTNLNRLVGAGPGDVGMPKVGIAQRLVQSINPAATCRAVIGDIVDEEHARTIGGYDFTFLCTDSHASRAVVGQAAYQMLVPVIDMGVSITVADGCVSHITGRVQMLSPGLPCLACTGALDGEQVRRELLTPEQRAADPYIIGGQAPQPAVISINSAMASLATTMFLGAVAGVPAEARFQRYDGIRGIVRPMAATIRENCIICSRALAQGIEWGLPMRPKGGRHG